MHIRVIEPEEFAGEKFEGVVIVSKFGESVQYGFITPTNGDRKRKNNVWFGETAAQGEVFEVGDVVSFAYLERPKIEGKPSAFRVWPKIKTLAGEK
jgi:hypothetical protein